jgi:hypothetical protein
MKRKTEDFISHPFMELSEKFISEKYHSIEDFLSTFQKKIICPQNEKNSKHEKS